MLQLSAEIKIPNTPLSRGEAAEITAEETRAALEYGLVTIQAAIVPLTPIDQGFLRHGVQTSLTGEPLNQTGRVFNPLAHAWPMEDGRLPGAWPPRGPIEAWVRRKLHVPEGDVRSVAFLVARKIARDGTKAAHMFRDGFNARRGDVLARFAQARANVVRRLAK